VFIGAGVVLAVIGIAAVLIHRGAAAAQLWEPTSPEPGEIRAQS
jgi:hypothetical protein